MKNIPTGVPARGTPAYEALRAELRAGYEATLSKAHKLTYDQIVGRLEEGEFASQVAEAAGMTKQNLNRRWKYFEPLIGSAKERQLQLLSQSRKQPERFPSKDLRLFAELAEKHGIEVEPVEEHVNGRKVVSTRMVIAGPRKRVCVIHMLTKASPTCYRDREIRYYHAEQIRHRVKKADRVVFLIQEHGGTTVCFVSAHVIMRQCFTDNDKKYVSLLIPERPRSSNLRINVRKGANRWDMVA